MKETKEKVEWKKLWFPPINLWTVPKRKDNDIRKYTKKDSKNIERLKK